MKKLLLATGLVFVLAASPVLAQQPDTQAAAPATADTIVPKPADWDQRMDLAKKIDEVIPARLQVEGAIDSVTKKLPPDQQKTFKDNMTAAIDLKTLEDVSINAMAQTFTVAELQRMVDYYTAPEYRAIAGKLPTYQQLVKPEIVRMLDKAAMEIRTGAPGLTPPTGKTKTTSPKTSQP